jgi:hypothetical protein
VVVLEEDAFNNFEALVKHVEFRHGTNRTVRPGMFLLFTNGWAARRRGRTGLLVAEVTAVHHCSVEEAYRRFPTDANQCNLQMRSARWSSRMISCIEVQNVRPAPEFRVLVPGNLGFLHQFELKRGIPQFCLASDLNKTVSVALRSGKIVQRTLMMSARARIHAAPSGEDDAVPHIGSVAPQRVDGIPGSTAPAASSRRRPLGQGVADDATGNPVGKVWKSDCRDSKT